MVTLPTSKNVPNTNIFPDGEVWCLEGPPKTGKTTMASTFPDALLIDVEGGGKYVECYRVVPHNLRELEDIISMLRINSSRYKTIILDSVDLTSLWIERDICQSKKVPSISSIPYGEGRSLLNTRLISLLDDLRSLNKTLVLITHTRDSSGKHSMLLTEQLATYVKGHSGIIGFCYKVKKHGKVRCLVDLTGGGDSEAGSRHPILSKIGDAPNKYSEIVSRFNELVNASGHATIEVGGNVQKRAGWSGL